MALWLFTLFIFISLLVSFVVPPHRNVNCLFKHNFFRLIFQFRPSITSNWAEQSAIAQLFVAFACNYFSRLVRAYHFLHRSIFVHADDFLSFFRSAIFHFSNLASNASMSSARLNNSFFTWVRQLTRITFHTALIEPNKPSKKSRREEQQKPLFNETPHISLSVRFVSLNNSSFVPRLCSWTNNSHIFLQYSSVAVPHRSRIPRIVNVWLAVRAAEKV